MIQEQAVQWCQSEFSEKLKSRWEERPLSLSSWYTLSDTNNAVLHFSTIDWFIAVHILLKYGIRESLFC